MRYFQGIIFCCSLWTPLGAATIYWDNGNGDQDWGTAQNWVGNSLPKSGDTVYFDDSGDRTIKIFSGDSFSVTSIYLGGTDATYYFNLGQDGSAQLEIADYLYVGYSDADAVANFRVWNDSVLNANAIVLGATGSYGKFRVDSGTVDVSSFLTLGSNSAGFGELEIDNNSSVTLGTNLNVGFYGEGLLEMESTSSLSIGADLRVGYYSGSAGKIDLDGAVSLTVNDDLTNYSGQATIIQQNGSFIDITDHAFLGENSTATGVWTLDNSSANIGDDFFVGRDGAGALTLSNGATVDVADYLVVARNSGSTGSVSINDSSSSLTAAYNIIGGSTSGDGGTGSFTLNDGSVHVANSTTLRSNGTLELNGGSYTTGSLLTEATGGTLVHNAGTLHLNAGNWDRENVSDWVIESADGSGTATVQYTGSSVDHSSYDLIIGDTNNGQLSLLTDSSIQVKDLYMGRSGGDGNLTINGDEASIRADNLYVGASDGSGGTASITVDDNHFVVGDADKVAFLSGYRSDQMLIADTGNNGLLEVRDNADVNIDARLIFLGNGAGTQANIVLGKGSSLTTDDTIYLGYNEGSSAQIIQSTNSEISLDSIYVGYNGGSGGWQNANGSVKFKIRVGDGSSNGEIYLTSGNSLTALSMYLGDDEGSTGIVNIEDSELTLSSTLEIGNRHGEARLTAVNSSISVYDLDMAEYSTSKGYLDISGGSLTVNNLLDSLKSGQNDIDFHNGAQVKVGGNFIMGNTSSDATTSLTSTLDISTATSTNPTFLDIAGDFSIKALCDLTIDQHSQLRVGNGDMSSISTSSSGFLLISGTEGNSLSAFGSNNNPISASIGGELLVGWSAGESGTLSLSKQSTVFSTEDNVRLGENGTANVAMDLGSTWYANGAIDMADETGIVDFSILGGSILTVDGGLTMGDNTGQVTMTIEEGSHLNTDYLYLADGASNTSMTLDNSNLTIENSLYIGYGGSTEYSSGEITLEKESTLNASGVVRVGYYGYGALNFSDSQWIQDKTDSSELRIGVYSTGFGEVDLKDGSEVSIERIKIGDAGTGSLTLQGSGTLLTQLNDSSHLIIGDDNGSSGSMTISNGASHIYEDTTKNNVKIGNSGVGHYTVTGNSSSSFASNVTLGYSSSSAAGSSFTVEDGSSFTGTDITISNGSILTIDGIGTTAILSGDMDLNQSGENIVILSSGAAITVSGSLEIGSDDSLSLLSGALLEVADISGSFTNTSGIFSPGNSPSNVTFDGDYTQLTDGTLLLEIGGTSLGTEYDFLNIIGEFELAGVVDIDFIDGYTPDTEATFDLWDAENFVNNGYTLDLPDVEAYGYEWDTSSFGVTGELSLVATVPEPSSLVLTALGALSLMTRRRRTKSL